MTLVLTFDINVIVIVGDHDGFFSEASPQVFFSIRMGNASISLKYKHWCILDQRCYKPLQLCFEKCYDNFQN